MPLRDQRNWALRFNNWFRNMEGFFLDFDNLEESLPPPVVEWGKSQITVANHTGFSMETHGGGKVWL